MEPSPTDPVSPPTGLCDEEIESVNKLLNKLKSSESEEDKNKIPLEHRLKVLKM